MRIFRGQDRRRFCHPVALHRGNAKSIESLNRLRVDGGRAADDQPQAAAKLIENLLENFAAYVDPALQEQPGKLQSEAHLAFEPFLFHRQHDSFINAFDEQRHAEKDRNPIFHDVFLQILQTVAVGCRRARRQHDKLSGSTEGVVIRQKSHVDVASADIFAKLQRVNIFDNIVL